VKPSISLVPITQGTESWDQPLEANLAGIVDYLEGGPLALKEYNSVTALPTASNYDRCVGFKQVSTTWTLRFSDGSSWYQVLDERQASATPTANLIPIADGSGHLSAGWFGTTLSALGGLTPAANKVPYFTGASTAGLLDLDTDTSLAANSDTRLATQKAVKAYIDTAVTGLLDFKGSTDASANPNYPTALKGDSYVISVAGKIGGASGKDVDIADVYVCIADNAGGTEASVGTSWIVLEHNLKGALLSASNLSDVASASTARSNLGLGSAAVLTASTTPTASAVPQADGSNKLAAGWLSEVLALSDLSDVTGKTGSGTVAAMQTDPSFLGLLSAVNMLVSGEFSIGDFVVANATNPAAQGNGPITHSVNFITAVTTLDCITLPPAVAKKMVFLRHCHATNTLTVYPASGDNINALAVNAAYTLVATRGLLFYAIDSTTWWAFGFGPV